MAENDPGLMAPRPEPEPGSRVLGRWSVSEYPATSDAPAHFRLTANGVLLAWGNPEDAPAVITLCRLAAAALKLVPPGVLTAELAGAFDARSEGDVRSSLVIAGAWRPHPD